MTNRSDASNVDVLSQHIIGRAIFSFDSERASRQVWQTNAKLTRHVIIRTAQLRVSNAKLIRSRELSERLCAALEEERTRISRDIHDQLGQLLTCIKIDVAHIHKRLTPDQQALRDKTTAVVSVIDEAIETMRHIASDLRPGILDDLGLVATLEWQAPDFQTRTGVCCEVTCNAPDLQLDRGAATGLFRMAQEALTNVARHAQATQVHITLIEEDGKLTLEVRDNGKGINESAKRESKSLGLLGLAERARLLGGTAEVTGVSGKGTTVTIKIPLDSTHLQAKGLEKVNDPAWVQTGAA